MKFYLGEMKMRVLMLSGFTTLLGLYGGPSAVAQQLTCQSRLVEQAFERSVRDRYGPSAAAQIQAIGSGQQVPMKLTITSMEEVGPLPGGHPGAVCRVAATFFRGDTGQSVNVTAQFWLVTTPRGSQIQIKAMSP